MYEYSSCAFNENQKKHFPASDLVLANVGVFFTMVSTAEPVKGNRSCSLRAARLGLILEGNLVGIAGAFSVPSSTDIALADLLVPHTE